MKRKQALPGGILAIVLAATAIAAVPVGPAGAAPSAHAARVAKIQLRRTSLGMILVDSTGFTLYRFSKDTQRKNTCLGTRECSVTWPALASSGTPIAGTGVKASLLSTIKLPGGSRQVTYAGHPLYLYSVSSERGETAYVGAKQFGGTWYAVNSSGANVR
jgi:predicted lipoprotein with Yx(FWY)xxD motif